MTLIRNKASKPMRLNARFGWAPVIGYRTKYSVYILKLFLAIKIWTPLPVKRCSKRPDSGHSEPSSAIQAPNF
jgi:hypothetical protein